MDQHELSLKNMGYKKIAGVDEVGRGPLAGPVVACAVIFGPNPYPPNLNDSKLLKAKVREEIFSTLTQDSSLIYGIGIIHASEIDEINILQASLKAMKIALEALYPQPDYVLIDGNHRIADYTLSPQETLIKGDQKSYSIAAASVIAKVTRDRMMGEYDINYPQYGFNQHKGYGTTYHLDMLKKYGPSDLHRKSFSPVRNLVENGQLNV